MSSTILSLIYRTSNLLKWGAGKGSNLNAAEVDQNFFDIQEALQSIADDPLAPKEINAITVAGNQMTIHLNDGTTTFGPFTLPVASLLFTGAWVPAFNYKIGNLFTANSGLYIVVQDYTSDSGFTPTAGNGMGLFAKLVMPFPDKVRVGWFWPTKPGIGLDALESGASSGDFVPMFAFICADAMYLTATLPGSVAKLHTPATASLSFNLMINGAVVGGLTFAAGSHDGVFILDDSQNLSVGDILALSVPFAVDATAHGLVSNIVANLGSVDLDSSSS